MGPPVRPLGLFYGLSQAGRAIAAAATNVTGRNWQLKGHGITALDLPGPLAGIPVRCDTAASSGSFTRLSEILDSSLWDKATRLPLRVFWDAIPENERKPLVDDDRRWTPLSIEHRSLYTPHPLASVPVCPFPPWVVGSSNRRQALGEYLSAFPTAQGYHSFVRHGRRPDYVPAFSIHSDGWGELQMNWQVDDGERNCTEAEQLAYLSNITRPYCESRYFFPLGGQLSQEHPSFDGMVGGSVYLVHACQV